MTSAFSCEVVVFKSKFSTILQAYFNHKKPEFAWEGVWKVFLSRFILKWCVTKQELTFASQVAVNENINTKHTKRLSLFIIALCALFLFTWALFEYFSTSKQLVDSAYSFKAQFS